MRAPAATALTALVAKNFHHCSVAGVGPWLAGVVWTSDSQKQ